MSNVDVLLDAQAQSGKSVDEDEEEVVRIQTDDDAELMEAVFELENGKAMKDEGERMERSAKAVLANRAMEHLAEFNQSDKELPKQFAFVTDSYTAWINTRPNGYGKLGPGMIEDITNIDESISAHIKTRTSVALKWGSIPDDKQGEAVKFLMEINKLVYGEKWQPSAKQPSLIEVTKVTHAKKDSFYRHQFTLAKTKMRRFQELLPIPFAISSKNGRKK